MAILHAVKIGASILFKAKCLVVNYQWQWWMSTFALVGMSVCQIGLYLIGIHADPS